MHLNFVDPRPATDRRLECGFDAAVKAPAG
jgi:hypothetical protein